MNQLQTSPSEPDENEIVEFLNKVDQGYVGLTKPCVTYSKGPDLVPAWQLEIEDGDHLRIDEQGYE